MLSMKDIVIIFLVIANVITLMVLACRKCTRDVSYKPIEVVSEMDDLL